MTKIDAHVAKTNMKYSWKCNRNLDSKTRFYILFSPLFYLLEPVQHWDI